MIHFDCRLGWSAPRASVFDRLEVKLKKTILTNCIFRVDQLHSLNQGFQYLDQVVCEK